MLRRSARLARKSRKKRKLDRSPESSQESSFRESQTPPRPRNPVVESDDDDDDDDADGFDNELLSDALTIQEYFPEPCQDWLRQRNKHQSEANEIVSFFKEKLLSNEDSTDEDGELLAIDCLFRGVDHAGSRSRWTHLHGSDVDIALTVKPSDFNRADRKATPALYVAKKEMERALLGLKVNPLSTALSLERYPTDYPQKLQKCPLKVEFSILKKTKSGYETYRRGQWTAIGNGPQANKKRLQQLPCFTSGLISLFKHRNQMLNRRGKNLATGFALEEVIVSHFNSKDSCSHSDVGKCASVLLDSGVPIPSIDSNRWISEFCLNES